PPSSKLIDNAVDSAPRLQPNTSARMGRNTPYAASGVEIPYVTTNSARTMRQRRGGEGIIYPGPTLPPPARGAGCIKRPAVETPKTDRRRDAMAQCKIPMDEARFKTGMTWKDYMAQMGDTRARTEENYAKTKLTDDERKFFSSVKGVKYVIMTAE